MVWYHIVTKHVSSVRDLALSRTSRFANDDDDLPHGDSFTFTDSYLSVPSILAPYYKSWTIPTMLVSKMAAAAVLLGSAFLQSASAFVPQMEGRVATDLFARKPFMYVSSSKPLAVRVRCMSVASCPPFRQTRVSLVFSSMAFE